MAIVQNFVGSTAKSDLSRLGKAETTNMFVESVSSQYSSNTILRGMPGWTTKYNVSGTPRGIYRSMNGKIFYGVGNKLYCDGVKILNLASGNTLSMCETGGHTPYLLVADGVTLFAINTTLSTQDMAQQYKTIEVPNDPWESTSEQPVPGKPIAIAMVYEHPMLLLKNTDRVYMGYQYPWEVQYDVEYGGDKSIHDFTPDDLFMLHWKSKTNPSTGEVGDDAKLFPEGKWISIDYCSDIANSMIACKGKLYVGGDRSIQAFSYVGGDFVYGEVWSCQNSECAKIGTYQNTLKDICGHYCFTGNDGVYVDGIKVSDDFIDRRIKNNVIDCQYLSWYSHKLYVINLPSETLAYDLSNSTWINLGSMSNGVLSKFRYGKCYEDIAMDSTAVVYWNENTYREHDNSPIVKRRRGGILMREGKTMQIDRLKFLSNNGQFTGNATLNIYVNGKLSESRLVEFSKVGEYDSYFEYYDLGIGKTFEVELLCDTNSEFGLYDLDVKADEAVY